MIGKKRLISASVGHLGQNRKDDVDVIQEMLNIVSPSRGGAQPLLKVDGIIGPKTIRAIQTFQLRQFGWSGADGRVDPDQQSMRWLRSYEGEFGRTDFKIARAELTQPVNNSSNSYYFILTRGQSAFYSLGYYPESNPLAIADKLTWVNELSKYRSFNTFQPRSVRSFETKSCKESIFPNPNDPAGSQIFLHLDLPRHDDRTDFVEVCILHRWIDPAKNPGGYVPYHGVFHLLKASI